MIERKKTYHIFMFSSKLWHMYNAWQLIWRFDVTVTTFTDVFAFLVGSNTVLPGLGNYDDDNDTDNENYNNNVVIDDDEYENF